MKPNNVVTREKVTLQFYRLRLFGLLFYKIEYLNLHFLLNSIIFVLNITHNLINTKHKMTSDIQEIIETLRKFNDDRDWEQFHNAKDLAIALSIEAAELSEAYLWKTAKDAKIEKVREELADIFNYAFMIADKYDLDVREICLNKIARNAEKYPVEKAKGNAKKYNEL